MGDGRKCCTIDKFRGDHLGSISYSPSKLLSGHHEPESHHGGRHLNGSYLFHKAAGESPNASLQIPPSAQNPNKAIVTINAHTTEILTANKLAFHLLGIQDEKGPSILNDFILSPEDQYLFSEADLKSNGELVLFSGKVMDLITSSREIVPVSVWARQLSHDGDYRCLVVMEPVERITGTVRFDSTGKIVYCDPSFSTLYGYYHTDEVLGINIKELIPSVEFGTEYHYEDNKHKEGTKQCLTARTVDGFIFPLSILINRCSHDDSMSNDLKTGDNIESKTTYEGVVWVFSNISGLITLLPDGTIHSCNTNFSMLLFGFTQQELVGKNVSALIPSFYDDVEFLDTDSIALPPFDDDEDSNAKYGTSDGRTTADSMGADLARPTNPMARSVEPKDEIQLTPSPFEARLSHSSIGHSSHDLENSPGIGHQSSTCHRSLENSAVSHRSLESSATSHRSLEYSATSCDDHERSKNVSRRDLENSGNIGHHTSVSRSSHDLENCANVSRSSHSLKNVHSLSHHSLVYGLENSGGHNPVQSLTPDKSGHSNLEIVDYSPSDTPFDIEVVKNDDLSASFNSSSKHLSCSESQDTLHSCTNSITESDVNANFFESREAVEKEECASDIFESESSSTGDEDENSFCEDDDDEEEERLSLHSAHTPLPPLRPPHRNSSESGLDGRCAKACSTPKDRLLAPTSDHSCQSIPEGEFVGVGRHRDGKDIAIEYYIKKVVLDDGKCLYCLWVSRDPDEIKECSPVSKVRNSNNLTETSNKKTPTTASERSCSAQSHSSGDSEVSESGYVEGSFSQNYTIVKHIGQGAFGCIKKAYRNSDYLLVIAKFIRKSEVYREAWVHDNKFKKEVPLEVSLLTTFDHPNIVKVLDVFENDRCFQMVMEQHGCGMDLFEFIERNPYMDEPLTSYIFRQIVAALSYLHSLSILHRDIKDENVIIDEKFHVKLIDFGSAAFMGEELFSSFCGTMEYCSPEVIRGNKYRGPELEMFALGVTLYTLEFGENPFVGADEILAGEYDLPTDISHDLSDLISHLLEPDPKLRCTLPQVEKHPWVTQPVKPEKYKFGKVITATEQELNPPKYMSPQDLDPDLESSNDTNNDLSYMETMMESVTLQSSSKSRSLTEPCSSTESDSIP